ncbi:MAG: tRNA preQ1(34) S-adenosylmethionine ribosyltransferase-isomerase QueA [Peptoniphilaceae bacterium]|nr:tRNA preQ1(34) S-adenosylmethionine ribosyltransferase-isomerase QueA [Peptoniphilaceae bacterium]MDD7383446.1 tRNA preQ1(34) S-adenosylmethionine ribosyltransferase-isomerase QueA [Peptoniphilaceae bacterium]MDY3738490.1 tRNA preQ1(34) S-adenosylmethionine ribosyltransferase-isomerase QueA [Peptoniphilaceae bacterium]
MNLEEFDYYLPPEQIAQHPSDKRDEARLMIVNKETGDYEEKHFYDIIDYLNPGDCLVMNDTRVIPARLFGHREGKNEKIEVFLLSKTGSEDEWEVLVKPGKKMKLGNICIISDELKCEVKKIIPESGNRIVKFYYDGNFSKIIEKVGNVPLPPYIKEKLEDSERYQTVYSKNEGSVAAPTAGLHFTKELLNRIRQKGVKLAFVTLDVGIGTFRPVKEEKIEEHEMHSEHYYISEEAAKIINDTKKSGRRVIAVGTTSTRTLEGSFKKLGKISADNDKTDIFIYPGYKYKVVDAMITNFHLPKSSLIMMISAFSDLKIIKKVYEKAVEDKFMFFSFGDAMFLY